MNRKEGKTIIKHLDFIIMDVIVLQLSFFLANVLYAATNNKRLVIGNALYRRRSLILLICVLVSMILENPYKNILKRDKFNEIIKTLTHTVYMAALDVLMIFFIHDGGITSRLTTIYTWVIYFILELFARLVWKRIIRNYIINRAYSNRQIVLYTKNRNAKKAVESLTNRTIKDYDIVGVFLEDYNPKRDNNRMISNVYVLGNEEMMYDFVTHNWVDEVIVHKSINTNKMEDIEHKLSTMGIVTHYVVLEINDDDDEESKTSYIDTIGDTVVLTRQDRDVPLHQIFLKRSMDIVGGIVGCIITCILFVVIGPIIYHQSPGPIFFSQDRVGKNGKIFKMYKFRSMYMDAEKRKQELMKQNNIKDGMMFKLDDDPRIIGSEKKDKNGKPVGIGNFIRRYSLDEFPQFFNVLKGDMSIVGTRPPTLDEWEKYSSHHRKRLSMRPGITGLWQTSGRSDITDFEKIVSLDCQYIDTWNITMDITIILKTIYKVLTRQGAK